MPRTPSGIVLSSLVLALVCAAILPGASPAKAQEPLPGTERLTLEGDLASRMVDGIDKFLLRETKKSPERRAALWHRDTSSPEMYEDSVIANRERLAKILGVVDSRVPLQGVEFIATTSRQALVGRGENYKILAVRWPVLRGVDAEGLLIVPDLHATLADVVAIPDADQAPELLAGLLGGEPNVQFGRWLCENRCRVLIPTLIDRRDAKSVTRAGRATNQPHREFVYRPAFELGRHVIGYEVQKVLAAVDFFTRDSRGDRAIGVFGYGEGGLLALYSAALDARIDVCCCSGYFDSRQDLWQEPIYRNVFGLLDEFGDAEVASLIAPRGLIVEACKFPEVAGPPAPRDGRGGAAPGRLVTPDLARVKKEFARAQQLVAGLDPAPKFELVVSGPNGKGPHGTQEAVAAFMGQLNDQWKLQPPASTPQPARKDFDIEARHDRQLEQLLEHTQDVLRDCEYVRDAAFRGDRSSPEKWAESMKPYREQFYGEVIGRFDLPLLPPNARTRKVFDEPKYTGYEVVLDVFEDVIAYGILLVPKGMKDGERRPVVVCQHGLEGRPKDVADPSVDNKAYNQYACRLAERGFITYAPQNPYIFRDRFRTLQRKANPLKKSLFSVIVQQHQQTTNWLASLPFVDPARIAFYGLSYGGKTAMRVPPLVENYCLSICSADFNEWVWKNASLRAPYSYVGTIEYEIFEFNLGHTFNYFEMAGLIAPRPFMVERGHKDGVAPDTQVAYEYAKIRRLYADLGIPERTTIEFFNGPHTIHGVGTFDFLHEKLNWPKKE
ncbi:MAG: hypothetical protein HYS13_03945 [Planctomycetia bacterium]|nr:hypothetical protein [Planctomycetia bacterium]